MNVLINGAYGRMGKIAVKALATDERFTLVGTGGRKDDLAKLICESRAQIVVDLTVANTVYQNALTIINSNVHPVIGTSGLTQQQIIELQQHCRKQQLGGIIVPNFSLGAVLMMQFATQAAHYFPYAEIIEAHHENKIDAPSATAIHSAELIKAVRNNANLPVTTIESFAGARGAAVNSVPVHSIRLPGYLAQQTILFATHGETLNITHNALNRECYMPGILLACKKVSELKELVLGLTKIM